MIDPGLPTVVIAGAGPAGLMAGLAASSTGARVRVVATGWGVFHWHAGCVDVLGAHPDTGARVDDPRTAVRDLVAAQPDHPYALVGERGILDALAELSRVTAAAGYRLVGSLDRNTLLPTGVGSVRAACLVPETMAAGDVRRTDATVVVGMETFLDLAPTLVADNLEHRGVPARGVTLDLPSLRRRRFLNGPVLAALFETDEFRTEVVAALRSKVGRATRIGFPAVLGIDRAVEVVADLSRRLGVEVFEIPIVPPSIPGMRLHRILTAAIRSRGGRVFDGMEATGAEAGDGRIMALLTEAAGGRRRRTAGDAFVLATGGILGGGIVGEQDGTLREKVFGLPVTGPTDRADWLRRDFTDPDGHPVYRSGVAVDGDLRPRAPGDPDGSPPLHDNLHAAGGALAGADAVRERSVDGIALATGWRAGLLAAAAAQRRHEEVARP